MARSRRKSKTPSDRGAFTLVELLVVIVIIGLLMALLVPSLRGVWQRYGMTRCQTNLFHIYQAFRLRAADEAMDPTKVAYGVSAWPSVLPPYLENDAGQFVCPEALEVQSGDAAPSRPLTDLAEYKNGARITRLEAGPYMLKLSVTQYNKIVSMGLLVNDGAAANIKTRFPEFATFVPDGTPDVYWLFLEDGGGWDYNDVMTRVTNNSDGTITVECVAGWTGGMSYLMDKLTGETLATCKGLPVSYKGPFVLGVGTMSASTSYGMNEYALDKVDTNGKLIRGVGGTGGKILVMDYLRLEAKATDIWTDQFFDPSTPPSGVPVFARHFGQANILFSDGSVRPVRVNTKDPPPEDINPIAPTTALKWWMP